MIESSEYDGVQVLIPAALNRPSHTLYSICVSVQPTCQEWTVNRRYSQFLQLKTDLLGEFFPSRKKSNLPKSLRNASGFVGCCPGCPSFVRAIQAFDFPHKTWIRTNRIVRKRVTKFQEFLKLLIHKLFNDSCPKCALCGERMKQLLRPFLLRGAQPLGKSTMARIQNSLSLQSYAIIPRKPQHPHSNNHGASSKNLMACDDSTSSGSTATDEQDMSESPTDISLMPGSHGGGAHRNADSTGSDEYSKQYGEEMCHDPAVPLEEAVKDVVVADGMPKTYEEIVFRLSTLWDAYAECEVPNEWRDTAPPSVIEELNDESFASVQL